MILELENVGKSFPHPSGNENVEVLRNLQLQVNQGDAWSYTGSFWHEMPKIHWQKPAAQPKNRQLWAADAQNP